MAYLFIEFGEKRLSVDTDKISIRKSKELARELVEIKKKHSPLAKFPIKDDETLEQWQERVLPQVTNRKDDMVRKDGELSQDYLNRVLAVELDDLALYFDCLKMIARHFDDENKVTEETFEDMCPDGVVRFIKDVLQKARIDVDVVFPKRFELSAVIQ